MNYGAEVTLPHEDGQGNVALISSDEAQPMPVSGGATGKRLVRWLMGLPTGARKWRFWACGPEGAT
ncbi:hypothetical protein OS189_14105 [Sulfitobacter sp. F26169L]|uniref:hypothetical protein n=1 Tax=Sulfitobacter sp. F26169L TaxID=2996015 RepID=UPI002260D8E7|nr:hypothetical protein [Sulfitobacter sp. F26169L]MCX7567479.1 hypothetical protein [Sulfitobacter sp. F26169L]